MSSNKTLKKSSLGKMPEHSAKKKGGGLHSTPSINKIPAIQEDDNSTALQEKALTDVDEKDDSELKESQEIIKKETKQPPKDVMKTEPILTRLIIQAYEGGFDEDGFYDGEGIAHFLGGHWYKGNFKHGAMHGQGVYCWEDGIMYAGEFTNNKISGNGVYSWPDGSIYEGEVLDGFRHGKGTYRCGTSPSMYTGDWVHGQRHGKGILYFDAKCETYYNGDWENGNKHGYGVHKYRSGNVYEGEWCRNIRHGQGKMHWYDKNEEYEGNWVNGIQNGYGKYTWYSKRVATSQYPIRNEYEGEFIDGLRNGFGTFYYASGAKYSGEWKNNVKHGKGEFMFKNGSVFTGMFDNDHIVDFPNVISSRMTTPEITESGLPVRLQTPSQVSPAVGSGSVDAVLDINLYTIFIEDKFDIDQQQIELDEVKRAVLRYMTPFKHVYKCYSSLGNMGNTDNTFVMNRIQFWRFLLDCRLHVTGVSLAQMDLAGGISCTADDIHDPSTQLYVRDFVNAIIHIAYLVYKENFKEDVPIISKCLMKFINEQMVPNACIIKGSVFANFEKTKEVMKYIDRCNEIFLYHRTALHGGITDKILRMRDFLYILKEYRLLNECLTTRRFLEQLHSENQSVLEDRSYNLEVEIVFLEFLETLVDCSQLYLLPRKSESKMSLASPNQGTAYAIPSPERSPILTQPAEEPLSEENTAEPTRSPITAPSPDKSTSNLAAETAPVTENSKTETIQPPSNRGQESTHERKVSTTGGSRRDQQGSKDGSSINGSRSRRRGTHDHVDTEGKFGTSGSATNSKGKSKDRGSKNGTKSAKKVVIDDERTTTVAAQSIVDPESDVQSTIPRVHSAVDLEESVTQSLHERVNDLDSNPGKSQGSSVVVDETKQLIEDGFDINAQDLLQSESPIMPISSQGVISPDQTAVEDESGECIQSWANNLRVFFEEHFFPAYEKSKLVDQAIAERRSLVSCIINAS